MRLVTSDIFKNLKIRTLNKSQSEEGKYKQVAPFTTLPFTSPEEKGILAPKRVNQVELFKKYTYQILPSLEKNVEHELLGKIFDKVSPLLRESITQTYLRKQVEQLAITPSEESIQGIDDKVRSQTPGEKSKIFLNDITNVQATQVGLFVQFKFEEFQKIFKHKSPGDFLRNHIKNTRNFSVQLTYEGINAFDYLDKSFYRPEIIQLLELEGENQQEQLDILLSDEKIFSFLFNLLKNDFYEVIRQDYRKDEVFERIFATGVCFDAIISVLVQELAQLYDIFYNTSLEDKFEDQSQLRRDFFKQLIQQIRISLDEQEANPSMPDLIFKQLKKIKVDKVEIDFEKYIGARLIPQSLADRFDNYQGYASTLVFYGDSGSTKSGILMQSALYAHKMGYLTVVVPSGYDLTHKENTLVRHHESGLYMQPEAAVKWLEQFRESQPELLEQIPVNLQLYGKYNFSGQHDNEPEAVKNIYDPRRKYFFKEFEKFYTDEENDFIRDENERMKYRLSHRLQEPKNILEIVEYGIKNPQYSTNAIYEILEQVYNQTQVKVLVVVDGFNWFYRPSGYPSFRYESNKDLRGHIPPYHLSLCRAFMHLDGYKIKNGYKIMASSVERLHQHVFEPKHIHVPNSYGILCKGLPLDHFRIFASYIIQTGYWKTDMRQQLTLEQFWMETQGNLVTMRNAIQISGRQ